MVMLMCVSAGPLHLVPFLFSDIKFTRMYFLFRLFQQNHFRPPFSLVSFGRMSWTGFLPRWQSQVQTFGYVVESQQEKQEERS